MGPLLPLLLTGASALLYAAAFPPLGLHPLAWVALVPWLVAASRATPAAAAGLGVVWSLVLGLGVAGWLPGMIERFFDTSAAWGWAGLVGVAVGLCGVHAAVFSAWLAWLARRGAVSPLLVGLGFCTFEYARATWPVANPWALSAVSQVPWSALVQSADFAGPYAVSFLVGATNAWLAGVWVPALRGRRPVAGAAAVAGLLAAALVYGGWRLDQRFAEGETVEVALVQSVLDRRSGPAHRAASLARQLDLTARAATTAPDLVLWPESSVDFYLREASEDRQRLVRESRALDAELLVGGPDYRVRVDGTDYYNSVFLLRRGWLSDRYDKVHLMPFSETNPLRALTRIGRDRYTPGREPRPLHSRHGSLGVLLCSEVLDSGHVRAVVGRGAELLVNPSNDHWFGNVGAARQVLAAASLRAIESRRALLRPSQGGPSAVIDPHGRVRTELAPGEPSFLRARVRASRAVSPYQRVGELAPRLAGGLTLVWTVFGFAARARPRQEETGR
jgi:apolipoprotein N-acyltransferase